MFSKMGAVDVRKQVHGFSIAWGGAGGFGAESCVVKLAEYLDRNARARRLF
jgi:hypothetical protein